MRFILKKSFHSENKNGIVKKKFNIIKANNSKINRVKGELSDSDKGIYDIHASRKIIDNNGKVYAKNKEFKMKEEDIQKLLKESNSSLRDTKNIEKNIPNIMKKYIKKNSISSNSKIEKIPIINYIKSKLLKSDKYNSSTIDVTSIPYSEQTSTSTINSDKYYDSSTRDINSNHEESQTLTNNLKETYKNIKLRNTNKKNKNKIEIVKEKNDKKSKVESKKSKVDSKKSKVDSKKPKVDSKKPKVDSKKSKVDSKKSKVESKKPKVDSKKSKV